MIKSIAKSQSNMLQAQGGFICTASMRSARQAVNNIAKHYCCSGNDDNTNDSINKAHTLGV
ncbi:MAG: hypothetical protein OXC48_07845 [Endozoicomonadaceae bacterium]|nr:hypothetical protein [Endozoicomonadaceae bacterium]